jgi:hypothetical protein
VVLTATTSWVASSGYWLPTAVWCSRYALSVLRWMTLCVSRCRPRRSLIASGLQGSSPWRQATACLAERKRCSAAALAVWLGGGSMSPH